MSQLSITEISKRFKINRTTIYRAVQSGKLSRLNNGLFDLAEVIRVFGEAPTPESVPEPLKGSNDQTKLIEVLERELLFLKNQIEQKDKQINSLQLLLETPMQRHTETECNTIPQHDETPIIQDLQQAETSQATNSNDALKHAATPENVTQKKSLFSRLDKGIKAFLK